MDNAMDITPRPEDLKFWVPIRVFRGPSGLSVDWCHIGDKRFTEPFFDVTITKRLYEPFSLLFRHKTPIDVLGDVAESGDCVPPTGFIFHMSRCGSTLISRMLAALGRNIVMSEPGPVDSVLRTHLFDQSVTDEQRENWFRWIIAALGRRRNENEKGYFIKFDSWSMMDMDLILRVFPDVPWIFVYRNPIEVIVSHMRKPGVQMVRGSIDRLLPGLPVMEALQMPAEEYCARVLARFCELALKYSDSGRSILVEYTDLPVAITGRIAEHFGTAFSSADIERMNELTGFDAKTPGMTFTSDSASKRESANDLALRAAEELVEPIYRRLREKQAAMGA